MPIFRSRHQAELLMWLLLHPDQEFGVTELAERIDVPLSTLHREVDRLDAAGLIASRSLGRNRLLRADRAHPAHESLARLLEVTLGPRVVIADEFVIPGAELVVIFGSWAARYEGEVGQPARDLDVLVIGDVDRADVYEAADRAQERLGLEVNPVVRSRQAWAEPVDNLVHQIKRSPHTVVIDDGEGAVDGPMAAGQAEIEALLATRELQQLTGSAARGEPLLRKAGVTIETARSAAERDPDSAVDAAAMLIGDARRLLPGLDLF